MGVPGGVESELAGKKPGESIFLVWQGDGGGARLGLVGRDDHEPREGIEPAIDVQACLEEEMFERFSAPVVQVPGRVAPLREVFSAAHVQQPPNGFAWNGDEIAAGVQRSECSSAEERVFQMFERFAADDDVSVARRWSQIVDAFLFESQSTGFERFVFFNDFSGEICR